MNNTPSIYLAPFQGITGSVYREVYTSFFPGIDKLFTPFFTAIHSQKSLSAKLGELDKTHHTAVEVVPQVLSNDAEEMIRFNRICSDMGFNEVNWNLGCPFRRVASKKRGSGLMQHPDLVQQILEKVIPSAPLKISVKCRLGYESPEEIFKILTVFNQFDLSELTVHARIGRQLYKGDVDLSTFKKVIGLSQIPLIYNGDIFTVSDFESFQSKFAGISKVMIGRGLLIDPFLPSDIKGVSIINNLPERKIYIRKFIDELYFQYRKKLNDRLHSINLMKELWGYMAFSFDAPGKVFGLVKKTKSFEEYEKAINLIFERYEWLGAKSTQFDASSL
jgi:tRNA-dihydrouridine synthase